MRQTHFTGNLDGDGNTQLFFIIEEAKKKKQFQIFQRKQIKCYDFILF